MGNQTKLERRMDTVQRLKFLLTRRKADLDWISPWLKFYIMYAVHRSKAQKNGVLPATSVISEELLRTYIDVEYARLHRRLTKVESYATVAKEHSLIAAQSKKPKVEPEAIRKRFERAQKALTQEGGRFRSRNSSDRLLAANELMDRLLAEQVRILRPEDVPPDLRGFVKIGPKGLIEFRE